MARPFGLRPRQLWQNLKAKTERVSLVRAREVTNVIFVRVQRAQLLRLRTHEQSVEEGVIAMTTAALIILLIAACRKTMFGPNSLAAIRLQQRPLLSTQLL